MTAVASAERWRRALEMPAVVLHRAVSDREYLDSVDPPRVDVREKQAAETALLLLIGLRGPVPDLSVPVVRLVVRSLHTLSSSPRYATLLSRCPTAATALAAVAVPATHGARRLGRDTDVADESAAAAERIAATLFSAELDTLSRQPFETAELQWIREEWVRTFGGPVEASVLDPTPRRDVSPLVHPVFVTEFDAYALTHEILFSTAFGARPDRCRPAGPGLLDVVESSLAWCVASDRFDLLGEFLLCGHILGRTDSPYWRLGHRVLRHAWDTFGVVPARGLGTNDGDDATGRLVTAAFHPTLVAGLLEAVHAADRAPRTAPDRAAALDSDTPATLHEASRSLLGATGWWARCADARDADVQRVVTDGLLSEAARGYRMDVIDQLTSRVAPDATPTARVAARFRAGQPIGERA